MLLRHSIIITPAFSPSGVRLERWSACAAPPRVRGRTVRAHDRKLLFLGHVRWTDLCAKPGEVGRVSDGEDHPLHGRDVHCCGSDRALLAADVGTDHSGGRVL